MLGIEGTAHTVGVGIVDSAFNICADARATFNPVSGGIHPRDASLHISENLPKMIETAFYQSGIDPSEINAISFSQGPGLSPCLRSTATGARALSLALDKPLIGINHALAHIELGVTICNIEDPLTLYVSGGNTQLTAYANHRYHIFGETQDIAIGNMIDTVARAIGYDYALAGPIIEKEAKLGKKFLFLPYSVKGTSVAYSGLTTAAIRAKIEFNEDPKDIAYSIQEVAFAMLAEITEKAFIVSGRKKILLTGGVAANKRLKEMLTIVAEENGGMLEIVPIKLAGDNGVMIAMAVSCVFPPETYRIRSNNMQY
ncbi:MAG: putative bifunctional tRNA threonylcarbamoyladenosine biosynthesis protein [Candidatus Heimdallarchaeota archaeon LC_3]|nr:MAG: putative bifunctional tRNA threonylcarbamoyladenosine biosynthesis protein [Candidatus Heimdallarchaeota archaeon LC_3]